MALDPDSFPLDDEITFELFQKGETVGIFQYESARNAKVFERFKTHCFR